MEETRHIFTLNHGIIIVTKSETGAFSLESDIRELADDNGGDNTEFNSAVDGMESFLLNLFVNGCVSYGKKDQVGQINYNNLLVILNSTLEAICNNT